MGKKKRKRSSLKARKQKLASDLETFIDRTKPKHRVQIAEHLCDVAIDVLGFAYGIDTSEAIVVVPEDSTMKLIHAINRHAKLTGMDQDAIVEKLITELARETASSFH